MNRKKRLYILLIVDAILLVALGVSAIFLVFNKQEQVFDKDAQSLSTIQQDITGFLEENALKYRPTALSDYVGETAEGIPILMYHDVVAEIPEEYDGNKLYVETFREHVKYLAENDYRTLTIDEFDKFYRGEIEVPKKSIVMTFDDGFRSVKELIEPILIEYNMHAISFIIGEKTANEPQWFVTPEEIEDLQTRNFVEFQSHSYHLHNAGSNGRGMVETIDTTEMLDDVAKENDLIGTTEIFCYPFGHAEEGATSRLMDAGISYGVTTAFGYVTRDTNQYILPRVRINANTSVADFASLITY
jgi:Predicted xylanase/chitin deacetylase